MAALTMYQGCALTFYILPCSSFFLLFLPLSIKLFLLLLFNCVFINIQKLNLYISHLFTPSFYLLSTIIPDES